MQGNERSSGCKSKTAMIAMTVAVEACLMASAGAQPAEAEPGAATDAAAERAVSMSSSSAAGTAPSAAASAAPAVLAAPRLDPYRTRPSVMLGLGQWIVFGGGNVAAQLKRGRFVFEYSHGQALDFSRVSFSQTSAENDAGVEVTAPWTTGGGFGYQITPKLHVLLELKAHHYQVRDVAGGKTEYTTFTAGPGIFYDFYLTKNLFLQPNLRWWPTIASTYDREATLMAEDGGTYKHERHDLPPFVNMNLGWTFDAR